MIEKLKTFTIVFLMIVICIVNSDVVIGALNIVAFFVIIFVGVTSAVLFSTMMIIKCIDQKVQSVLEDFKGAIKDFVNSNL